MFQNRRLLESVSAELAGAGLRVLVPQRLPVNDGGIVLRPGRGGGRDSAGAMTEDAASVQEILAQQVFLGGANRPFGSVTADDARAHADELRAAVGWGPTARVAPVAQAWRELSMTMDRAGVATVADLDPETLVELAPRLWVTMPG